MNQPLIPFVKGQRVKLRDQGRDRTFNHPAAHLTVVDCHWNPEAHHYTIEIRVEVPGRKTFTCLQSADDFEPHNTGDRLMRLWWLKRLQSLLSVVAIVLRIVAGGE